MIRDSQTSRTLPPLISPIPGGLSGQSACPGRYQVIQDSPLCNLSSQFFPSFGSGQFCSIMDWTKSCNTDGQRLPTSSIGIHGRRSSSSHMHSEELEACCRSSIASLVSHGEFSNASISNGLHTPPESVRGESPRLPGTERAEVNASSGDKKDEDNGHNFTDVWNEFNKLTPDIQTQVLHDLTRWMEVNEHKQHTTNEMRRRNDASILHTLREKEIEKATKEAMKQKSTENFPAVNEKTKGNSKGPARNVVATQAIVQAKFDAHYRNLIRDMKANSRVSEALRSVLPVALLEAFERPEHDILQEMVHEVEQQVKMSSNTGLQELFGKTEKEIFDLEGSPLKDIWFSLNQTSDSADSINMAFQVVGRVRAVNKKLLALIKERTRVDWKPPSKRARTSKTMSR